MKIPNICKNSVLLSVILYTQLLVFTIYVLAETSWSFQSLGTYTMYMQWVALGSLFVLCTLRTRLNKLSAVKTRVYGLCLCFTVALMVECIAAFISNKFIFDSSVFSLMSMSRLIALFICFLVLFRLFDLLAILEKRHQAESISRLDALQSRIRPHFLFNSLNTISELTATQPEQAEAAIDALAMLFRANLETDNVQHSLQREIDLCERYLDLERWRLAERLRSTVSVSVKSPQEHLIPKLLLQPLIENAIVHGMSEAGDVQIELDIRETNTDISIKVDNLKGSGKVMSHGNGIAINNIQERLIVLYDDQHTFRVKESDERYSVIVRLPKRKFDGLRG